MKVTVERHNPRLDPDAKYWALNELKISIWENIGNNYPQPGWFNWGSFKTHDLNPLLKAILFKKIDKKLKVQVIDLEIEDAEAFKTFKD